MRYASLTFFVVLCMAATIWSVLALSAQYVRLEYGGLISAIRSGTSTAEQLKVDKAIAHYESITRIVRCNAQLQRELALLSIYGADIADAEVDTYLGKTLHTLSSLLSCMPTDGKAWLDYATLNTTREGFTGRSLAAYKMSQRVTPGESWLAEKRLLFALKVRPLFDAEALKAATSDIDTLQRGHPMRILAVLKEANLKSADDLYALFSDTNSH